MDLIGNLAQTFVGFRGLNKQQKKFAAQEEQAQAEEAQKQAAQQESLARVLSGLGVDVDPGMAQTLAGNSGLLSEALQRSRPQPEPKPDKPASAKDAIYLQHPETGEVRPVWNSEGMKTAWSEGYRREVPPEEADGLEIREGPDGIPRAFDPAALQAGEPVFPGVQAPAAPDPQRRIITEGGANYYEDTGERVLPEAAELPTPSAPAGRPQGAKVSELESKAIQAADRVGSALNVLLEPTEDGRTIFELGADLGERSKAKLPGGNYLVSQDFQRFQQALSDGAQALLRLETGAAAPQTEVDEIMRRYGPRAGDKPETIQQKLDAFANRYRTAVDSLTPSWYEGSFDLSRIGGQSGESDISQLSDEELELIARGG